MFSTITLASRKFINKYFDRWLSRRVPSRFEHKLSNRNIFIMPTRFGFAYLIFVVLLFLLGTNYQNNIILLLSYLLASLFITVMLHSFYNFSQLTFSSNAIQTSFAKQVINFPIIITGRKTHYDINFQFCDPLLKQAPVTLAECDTEAIEVLLPWYAKHRGVYTLGRVKVFSEYSLGLFISWSQLDFSHQAIVFPEPKRLSAKQQVLAKIECHDQSSNINIQSTAGGDDFTDLKNYVLGESQARIAWKQLARGQGKFSKNYQAQQGGLRWLQLSDMPSTDIETKLKFLCFLILEYSKNNQKFGLMLDLPLTADSVGIHKIEPNIGYEHQEICLISLAKVKRLSL